MNTENDTTKGAVPAPRPLGFWLRVVDRLIADEFASTLDAEGVSRREWMLLTALSGDVDMPGSAERLARKGKHLQRLRKRGWADESGDGTWSLTDEGLATKARLDELVRGIRARVAGSVSPEDFATTLASLESIARELGWDENSSRGFRGRGFGRRRGHRRGHGRHGQHGHGWHGEHHHGHGGAGCGQAGPQGADSPSDQADREGEQSHDDRPCHHHGPEPLDHNIHHDHGPNMHRGFKPGTGEV
ncbi:hypothetical protein [Microbacterium marmarense]|uniref:MarR family transcriptional regulator n=1 Tax=Microbacterium marmarense TaxID=3122051 RepID=A0ABU8LQJ3_9MICO